MKTSSRSGPGVLVGTCLLKLCNQYPTQSPISLVDKRASEQAILFGADFMLSDGSEVVMSLRLLQTEIKITCPIIP